VRYDKYIYIYMTLSGNCYVFSCINEWQRKCTEIKGRREGGLNYVWCDKVVVNNNEMLRSCELHVTGLGYYVVEGVFL
jgi:hypothetical protein